MKQFAWLAWLLVAMMGLAACGQPAPAQTSDQPSDQPSDQQPAAARADAAASSTEIAVYRSPT